MCFRNSRPPLDDLEQHMEFKYVQEPYLTEISQYIWQRREHLQLFATVADVKAELLRNVTDNLQPIDSYPRGRQLINDDDYVMVIRDMFNLSTVLDDMEMTGAVAYHQRSHYYQVYSKLYRMLVAHSKNAV